MAAASIATVEPTTPTPPRFRWLKRWLIFTVALVPILAICWLWWNHVANRRLRESLDAVAARHEPLYPDDFNPPPLPAERNAGALLQAAAAAMVSGIDSPSASNYVFNDAPPYPALWHALINAAIAADGRALALARQARAFDSADWGGRFRTPVMSSFGFIGSLNAQRDLANLIGDAALYAHVHGDDAEAIERVLDEMHQADVINNGQGLLVGWLVGVGINAMAINRFTVIAPGLHIQGAAFNPPATTMPTTAVRRDVIILLIQRLLDERAEHEAIRQALIGERMAAIDFIRETAGHSLVLRPLFKLEITHTIETFDTDMRAGRQPDLPSALAVLGSPWVSMSLPIPKPGPRLSRVMSSVMQPSLSRCFVAEWRVLSQRRVAAISLAAQLYRADHGRLPASLTDLVPAYLPAVPLNPLSDKVEPMRYVLLKDASSNGVERPLVFFDSEPGKTPSTKPPAAERYGWYSGNRQWADISRWAPAGSATQPADEGP